MKRKKITVDGCTACALVAYATNELITIYPSPLFSDCGDLRCHGSCWQSEFFGGVCPMSARCSPRRCSWGGFTVPSPPAL